MLINLYIKYLYDVLCVCVCVLRLPRDLYGMMPTSEDADAVFAQTGSLLADNGVPTSLVTREEVEGLCRVASSYPINTISIMGSCLSLELIKAVALTGMPACFPRPRPGESTPYNVFVSDGSEVTSFPILSV